MTALDKAGLVAGKMTAAHLEALEVGIASLRDEADGAIAQSKMFSIQSAGYAKYLSRAAWITGKAARLAEVADHLAAQIERNDDAG
jgi:hypothetical protein